MKGKTKPENVLMAPKIRRAVYAGSFYPAKKDELSKMIDSFLAGASPENFSGRVCALVVPHAGYVYSGPTAAFAYMALAEAKPKRVFLMGPSHHDYFDGALGFEGAWETPLGRVSLEKSPLPIIERDEEHSLEVQLPFLQKILGKFEFVPVIYAGIEPEALAKIAEGFIDNQSVLVASSDLSHYLPYGEAKETDASTINAILALDEKKFLKIGDACGKTGIAALIILAKKYKWRAVLLDYRNSGDTAGDKNAVVGYAAVAFVKDS